MISIIMSVFNGEVYIEEALKSVLNQTYEDFELLIIDDGSIDSTNNIINSFDDNRIKYFYQTNQGQAKARSFGLDEAKGEYIAFIDADDIYIADKLEKQLSVLDENEEIGVTYNPVQVFSEDDKNYVLESEQVFENQEDFLAYILFRQIVPSPASMLVRKEVLGEIRFDCKYRYSEDYKFVIDLGRKTKFKYIDDVLYRYRRHDSNVTNNHQKQVNAEISVIKELGINKIKEIVSKSNFSEKEKSVLLAKILLKINENEEAYKILRKIENKDAYNYFYMGNISFEEKRYTDAKCEYEKAINLDDSLAEVYNNLGVCEYMLGDKEVAKEKFLRAIAINSIYMDANYNLTAIENLKITKRELRKKLTKYNI
ncbi:MAG: glycosyltransferase [Sarcina sp.]